MKKSKLIVFPLVLTISLTSVAFADTLKVGSKGAEVIKLQTQLKKLGYFNAEATGYYGSITEAAVKKFQKAKGISADGIAGTQTSKALYSTGTSSTYGVASKEDIKKVQEILKKVGLYKGKVDGLIGNMTKSAVAEFQKKQGMKATGIIDEETKERILKSNTVEVAASRGGSSTDSQTTRIDAVNAGKSEEQLLEAEAEPSDAEKAAEEDIEQPYEGEDLASEEAVEEPLEEELSAEEAVEAEPAVEAEKGKIEVLDWWTEASKVFARGTTAKVIDVRTGKSFYVQRTYGGNHADCETLTKEDTRIMKEIWGGSFSWTRRPVVLEINGRFLAASMAAMPHAGLDSKPANVTVSGRSGGYGRGTNLDTVKNNNMDGHFDIHFKNSRTHGTNKVDAAHQNAIKEAAEAKL